MTRARFRDDAYLRQCDALVVAVTENRVALDQTVGYPTGGGQPGDSGYLHANGASWRVTDTSKDKHSDLIWHTLAGPPPALNTPVRFELDWARRYRHMRFHTCLHVLCSVIRAPVTGGQISAERARLDFAIDLRLLAASDIAAKVNVLTQTDTPTRIHVVDDATLDANPHWVKTMSVSPPRGVGVIRLLEIPGIDLQPCGGTHVANLKEIGPIDVVRIRNEGKHNKRVEIAFVE
jgi:misacylated tRNA(Ala) deacylase